MPTFGVGGERGEPVPVGVGEPQLSTRVRSLGPDGVAAFAARVPVRRNGRPEDIAHAFAYLASEEASFVTGQTLVVDGGITVREPA